MSGHDLIAGPIRAGDLHASLLHECTQQGIERQHQVVVSADLERADLLDAAQAFFLDVAGDDARERAPEVGGIEHVYLVPYAFHCAACDLDVETKLLRYFGDLDYDVELFDEDPYEYLSDDLPVDQGFRRGR